MIKLYYKTMFRLNMINRIEYTKKIVWIKENKLDIIALELTILVFVTSVINLIKLLTLINN